MERKRLYHEENLAGDLFNAMKRLEKLGIVYPDGYYASILEKYNLSNIHYPSTIRHIGDPRISRHFFYPDALGEQGYFLDYGCGTGDDIRQLIRDGYPREKIHGFDVDDAGFRLGVDLYLDFDEMEKLVFISPEFSFEEGMYDLVYSGSVIHVIRDENDFKNYLSNAYNSLRYGGVFFGSTIGLDDSEKKVGTGSPMRLMHGCEIENALKKANFSDINIIQIERPETERSRLNICRYQFFARKK